MQPNYGRASHGRRVTACLRRVCRLCHSISDISSAVCTVVALAGAIRHRKLPRRHPGESAVVYRGASGIELSWRASRCICRFASCTHNHVDQQKKGNETCPNLMAKLFLERKFSEYYRALPGSRPGLRVKVLPLLEALVGLSAQREEALQHGADEYGFATDVADPVCGAVGARCCTLC